LIEGMSLQGTVTIIITQGHFLGKEVNNQQ